MSIAALRIRTKIGVFNIYWTYDDNSNVTTVTAILNR